MKNINELLILIFNVKFYNQTEEEIGIAEEQPISNRFDAYTMDYKGWPVASAGIEARSRCTTKTLPN